DLAPGVKHLMAAHLHPAVATDGPSEPITRPAIHIAAIASLKLDRNSYPNSPILYVELARNYVSLGQLKQAARAFRRALALAPHNRYVLRSAVRFFIHSNDPEAAWFALRSAPINDPWILSSKIAVAEILRRPQENIKNARQLIEAVAPSQGTELSASVGTLELAAGSFKQARKLFRLSAQEANDNTVAQLRWAHEAGGIPFDERLLATELSFEARTSQSFSSGDWIAAGENAKLWQLDEPYSSRPATVGCFISADILRDFSLAEHISTVALMSMPNDAMILNNRAYARIQLGHLDEAEQDLKLARHQSQTAVSRACLAATDGCLLYRRGDSAAGAESYRLAIQIAEEEGEAATVQSAYIHWLAEDLKSGVAASQEEVDVLRKKFSEKEGSFSYMAAVFEANVQAVLDERKEGERIQSLVRQGVEQSRAQAQLSISGRQQFKWLLDW
ncbi:MAG: tetratricopeptide repeat protein, partial [Pseudomonadota bacterium]